jgi:putative Mg2+ transporter-C (MgtC) family protein
VIAAVISNHGGEHIGDLALAFVLSSLIGLEREWRHKATGLRTHTLVGVGAALFVIISKYGFTDVAGATADPSRVAAQVVTGIGFIGGGLIFLRGDAVRGLTTASIVWMTAAVGMACGAGMAAVALVATAAHFLAVVGYRKLAAALPRSRYSVFDLRVVFEDGRGSLRDILAESTNHGFAIIGVATRQLTHEVRGLPAVAVTLALRGQPSAEPLAVALSDVDGVLEVATSDHAQAGA